ncbi:unnamed protein product [Closterium sp. NIES-64]|nr:unnamed protein product [Closterium sp. NIES-64]
MHASLLHSLHSLLSLHSSRLHSFTPPFPSPLPPFLSLSRSAPFWSQQVAHTGVAVAGDMECTGSSCSPPNSPTAKSLTREWQWRGTWSAQAAAALHPTHQQLSSCPASLLPFSLVFFAASPVSSRFKRKPLVEGRGVGVNTDAPSCPSPVAVQVAVVGGEGGSTPLGWDGMGEYRDGLSEPSLRVGALEQGQESQVHPLTHLLLSPFSLPSQQHPAWTTVDSPPSVHPPLPSRPPSQQPKASWRSAWLW